MGKSKSAKATKPTRHAMAPLPSSQSSFQIGLAHHQRGELEQAAQQYRATLDVTPTHFEALNLLGVVALQRNDVVGGIEMLQQAIHIKPDFAAAHLNLGNALRLVKRHQDALASYDRAIILRPDFVDAHSNRGVALQDLGRYQEAVESCDRALAIRPDYASALSNRGNSLGCLGRHEEALASYECILKCNPNDAEALNNRGVTLKNLQRPGEALLSFDRAVKINPDYVQALANRAHILQVLKRHREAIACYAEVIRRQPDYPLAIGSQLQAQLHICDWTQYAQTVQQVVTAVQQGKPADTPSFFLAVSDSVAAQLQCARTYIANHYPPTSKPVWQGERYQHERIRIAYLSADFHNHATAYLMAELFELHDQSQFEVSALSFSPDTQSDLRQRLARSFHPFTDVRSMSDRAVAELLRQREIDIAVDLKGFTYGSRTGIFANRAAPLQVNYLGYPGTIGATYIDYILADSLIIPEGQEQFYAEKVVRLPDSYQVNDSCRTIAARTPSRSEMSLPETGLVFCSFNNNYKITPIIFEIWMRLLAKVPGSVLWLLQDNADALLNLRREAVERGIAPQRLIFAPRMPLAQHLARHRLADLFLDTLPVNAHTTASDALWAGLPVLTCMGNAFASRVAGSLLHAVGLPEMVTSSLADYEALALHLATAPARLAAVKSRLEQNRLTRPLFDTARFRRHIESAYLTMHQRYQQGLAPESFAVIASHTTSLDGKSAMGIAT